MKNNKGFLDVFSFTFIQTFKSKAIIIVTAVLCVLAFASVPMVNHFGASDENTRNEDEKNNENSIKKVFLCDKSGIGIDKNTDILQDGKYKNIKYEIVSEKEDAKKLVKNTNNIYMMTSVTDRINIEFIYDDNKDITSMDVDEYSDFVCEKMPDIEKKIFGITKEQNKIIEKNINIEKKWIGQKTHKGINNSVMMSYICIIIIILTLCGETISTSVAMEKSTRVIEYLTINVKPIVLISGKVIGVMSVIISQFLAASVCFFASAQMNGNQGTKKAIAKYVLNSESMNISFVNVLIVLVTLISGVIVFGMLAGLAGAAVSRVEALGESMKIYSIILVIGAYAAMFLASSGEINTLTPKTIAAFIFPVTSLFLTPVYAVFGKVSITIAIAAMTAMVITAIVLVIFVSKVYEGMIYYKGETLRLKDIITFSKDKIKEERDV